MKSNLIVFVFIALFSTTVQSEVSVFALDIPGLHQKDGKGEYDKIISKAVVQSGKAKVVVLPPARAEAEFTKCNNCCLSPANKNPDFYEYGDNVVVTKAMSVAKVYIFTGKGEAIISDLKGLAGKNVGARNGMPYGKKFDASGISPKLVSDIKTNIKKIDSGRIDAFIAYYPDAYTVFEELGIDPYPHDVEHPIAVHPDSLICRGTGAGFIKEFNAAVH
ncbi:hypothetical protein A9Q81_08615 [Gammaproteobacteria bacterium 42_54_T18]|nr:hypothetical protein A9Q81_08615 [Gammaproteobacteria bacterium 42_54_T18]